MSSLTSGLAATEEKTSPATVATASKVIQPAWVRVMHWTNAVAIILMIMSGLQIYNASPLFKSLTFSHSITLGGWLGGALLWHFAAMWLLMINGLAYLVTGFATGRFTKKLLPISPRGVISDAIAAMTFKLSHDDLSKYNQVQKLLYTGIIIVGIVIVLSGFFDLEAGAASISDGAVRRLRHRALCAFLLHGLDRRLSGDPCSSGPSGAEEPAGHDHRALRSFVMGRLRKLLIPGVDKQLLVKDATKMMPDLVRRRFITGGASFGALTLLTGCDVLEFLLRRGDAQEGLEIQRRLSGLHFQSRCDGADLPGERHHQAVPVQRLL